MGYVLQPGQVAIAGLVVRGNLHWQDIPTTSYQTDFTLGSGLCSTRQFWVELPTLTQTELNQILDAGPDVEIQVCTLTGGVRTGRASLAQHTDTLESGTIDVLVVCSGELVGV